jgi:hypothetical protein
MKSKLTLIVMMALTTMPGLFGAANGGGLELWDVPKFNGYMGVGDDVRFALTPIAIDRLPAVNLSWVRIGQKAGAYEVISFDPKTEVLVLKKSGFENINVHLVESKVREATAAPVVAVGRDAARKYAFDLVAAYLKKVREEHPDRKVTVDPDVALMPEDQRARFLARQKMVGAVGQLLIPFISADGRWGAALSTNEAGNLPPEIGAGLTDEDRHEINRAWTLARAEEYARSIEPRVARGAK